MVTTTQTAQAAGLAESYTAMPEREAQRLLSGYYGLSATLKRFATEKDDTFAVRTSDGQKFVLKIANPGESFGEIDFQHAILRTVERQDPGLPVPRVIASLGGEHLFAITDGSGQKRYVRLLSFLNGTPLDQTDSSAEQRQKIGETLARLRLATEPVTHPAQGRVLAWDVQHLASLDPLLDEISDREKKVLLRAGMDRFLTLQPQVRACRQQVLHNDFSRSNIVVDHETPGFVTGIIDFGDAVKTAIAIDVSTALLNQLPREPQADMFAAGRDLLEGYLSIAELNEDELRLIPHLVMARVVARALITLWRARMFPDNQAYILRNTEQGWHQLAWFLDQSMDQVSTLLLDSGAKGKT
ncbi:MAG: phosphotransferase [Hyphomicrobiales bacterium]|jgi:hydroxylysine kinase